MLLNKLQSLDLNMQPELKALFFELLIKNEKLFDFIQEYAENGLCVLSNKCPEIWLDNKILKKIGKENKAGSAVFDKSEYFSKPSLDLLDSFVSLSQQYIPGKKLTLKGLDKSYTFAAQIEQFLSEGEDFFIVAFGEEVADIESSEATRLVEQLSTVDKVNFLKTIYLQDIFFFGIMEVDENEDFRYGFLNKYYEDILGVKNEYLQGKTPKEIVPEYLDELSAEVINNDFRECYQTGKIIKRYVEIEIAGKRRFNSVYIYPIRENDGKITSLLACGIDITELRELEKRLFLDNEFLRQMYEATPAMSHSIDEDGYIRYVSDKWLKKLGYAREEVIGKKSVDFFTEESREYSQQVVLPDFFTKGFCEDVAYEMLTKSGEILNVRLSGKLLKPIGERGKVSIAYIEDVTQEAIAKQEKSKTESILTDLLNNTKIHLWAFDGELYQYMNKEWFDYTGQDPKLPLTIERWTERVHPEDLPKAKGIWLKHFEQKTEHDNFFRLKRYDGVYRSFQCKAIPVTDKFGKFLYFQGHNIDITERLEAEKNLKESKERLALSVEAAEIGLWDWRLDTKEGQYNEKYAQIIGYSLEEITPMTSELFMSLVHPEDFHILIENLEEHAKGVTPHFECEIRMKHKNGHLVWVFNRGRTIEKDKDGNAIRMSGTLIDITGRKLAEQAIKESEERLQKLTQNVPGVIYQYEMTPDGQTYFSFLSNALKNINDEFQREEIAKNPKLSIDLIHPDDKPIFENAIIHSKNNLTPFNLEYRFVKKDGSIRWHNASSIPEKQADGTIIWYGIFQDITEKIEAKKQMEQLAQIAENTSDMIYTCDEKGRITWANGVHLATLGLDPNKIIGKKPSEKIKTSKKGMEKVLELENALINHKPYNDIIFRYIKDGQPIWLNYNVTPIFNKAGEFLYSIVSKTDVSELIQQQKELKKLLKMSSDQNKRLKEYSYITSHNIRSNVASILGLVDLLLDAPDEILFIEKLDIAAKQLDVTIRNINELLKLEKEYADVELAKYDVGAALDRIISLNQQQVEEKQAIIKIDLNEPLIIDTIPAYLDSIIQNLLTNALKYGITETQKELIICVKKEKEALFIEFKDKGLGIDMEKYGEKLFSLGARFHRLDKGNGLGLYMTLRQLEALKGKIHVDSKENEGSTFIVELPL